MKQKKSRYLFSTINSGSTLFCALLSNTIRTWSEPPTLDVVKAGSFVEVDQPQLHLATALTGKKVFLYRSLPTHLCAGMLLGQFKFHGLHKYWLEKWIDTIELGLYSSDVLWIESNDFFRDVRGTMDKVCAHFKIPKIKSTAWAGYNVKVAVPKRTPHPLILKPPTGESDYCAKDGIIDYDKSLGLHPVKLAVEVVRKTHPHLTNFIT